jgi:hypothetical protein
MPASPANGELRALVEPHGVKHGAILGGEIR